MRILKNNIGVKLRLFFILSIIWQGFSSCDESPKEYEIGKYEWFYYMFPDNFRPLVDVDGGKAVVPVHEMSIKKGYRFLFGTMHEPDWFSRVVEDFSSGQTRCFLWPGADDPENFDFHSTDLINLCTDKSTSWSQVTDEMIAAGAEVIENATEFDYQWIHVAVGAENVHIDVAPNPTGVDRQIILLFDGDEPWLFNNMIEVRQLGE